MLAQHQNHRESSEHEREHGTQIQLEERGIITAEPTEVITKAGGKRNGNLRFTLRPIQEVMDEYYARQMEDLELAEERQRVAKLLTEQESPA